MWENNDVIGHLKQKKKVCEKIFFLISGLSVGEMLAPTTSIKKDYYILS